MKLLFTGAALAALLLAINAAQRAALAGIQETLDLQTKALGYLLDRSRR